LLLVGSALAQDNQPVFQGAKVAVVPPALVSPFHVGLEYGAVEQARLYGWDIITQSAERETDFEGQVSIVEQVVQQCLNALSINPIDADAVVAGVEAANDAG